MRKSFDEQLAALSTELIEMGALCEEAIAAAAKTLIDDDDKLVQSVINMEDEIDRREHIIENMCFKLFLKQQPVARDLRRISAALKMITDMERIGDQALDITEMSDYIRNAAYPEHIDLGEMARAAVKMVTESVDAYVKQDVEMAGNVIAYDDVLDKLFVDVKKAVTDMISADPQTGEYAVDLMMTAKYFERIGDHAVNIAEWVEFSVTGVHKGEMTDDMVRRGR